MVFEVGWLQFNLLQQPEPFEFKAADTWPTVKWMRKFWVASGLRTVDAEQHPAVHSI